MKDSTGNVVVSDNASFGNVASSGYQHSDSAGTVRRRRDLERFPGDMEHWPPIDGKNLSPLLDQERRCSGRVERWDADCSILASRHFRQGVGCQKFLKQHCVEPDQGCGSTNICFRTRSGEFWHALQDRVGHLDCLARLADDHVDILDRCCTDPLVMQRLRERNTAPSFPTLPRDSRIP